VGRKIAKFGYETVPNAPFKEEKIFFISGGA
jgi:hypothetical protein